LNCWKIIAVSRRQAQGGALEAGDVALLADDAAGGRLGQAVEHAQQRRFAGTGAADDADHLALGEDRLTLSTAALPPKRLVRPSMRNMAPSRS
jgi:hypothetical protein